MARSILIDDLHIGDRFKQNLFLPNGQRLLGRDVALTERHLQVIQRTGEHELFLANTLGELKQYQAVTQPKAETLKIGAIAESALVNASGQVIVEAGQCIEAHHLDAVTEAGDEVYATNTLDQSHRHRIQLADAVAIHLNERADTLRLRVPVSPVADWLAPTPTTDWPSSDQLSARRAKDLDRLSQIIARIEAGLPTPITAFDELLDPLLRDLAGHPHQFCELALITESQPDYLPDHLYTVAVLAMAIGVQLGWPQDEVHRLGQAGLIYDLGMLLIPQRIRVGGSELSTMDRERVHRHPVFGLALLECIEGLSDTHRLVTLQHHERENGTGYPYGKRGRSLTDHARIIAVADSYAATTERRQHRPERSPFAAMKESVRDAEGQAFWPTAVTALVCVAGLFPVGSYVTLSDNTIARVMTANPLQPAKPVVQSVDERANALGQPIDLSQRRDLKVSRATPKPGL